MALIDFLVKVLCESPDDRPKRGSFPRRYIQKDVFKSEHALICPFRTIPDEPGLYMKFLYYLSEGLEKYGAKASDVEYHAQKTGAYILIDCEPLPENNTLTLSGAYSTIMNSDRNDETFKKIAESVDYATMKTLGGKYELTNVAIRNGFYSRIWKVYRNDLEWENRDDIKRLCEEQKCCPFVTAEYKDSVEPCLVMIYSDPIRLQTGTPQYFKESFQQYVDNKMPHDKVKVRFDTLIWSEIHDNNKLLTYDPASWFFFNGCKFKD